MSSDRKEQFAVRLDEDRAEVIRRHRRLYDDATRADALRAAVDALRAKHREAGADASHKVHNRNGGSGLGAAHSADDETFSLDP